MQNYTLSEIIINIKNKSFSHDFTLFVHVKYICLHPTIEN